MTRRSAPGEALQPPEGRRKREGIHASPAEIPAPLSGRAARPLHALISQVLVAYTIEADNEFEHRMAEAGDHGARLSLFVWFNLLRFLADAPAPVCDLERLAIVPIERLRAQLGCLERWRFIRLCPPGAPAAPTPRVGWGSGRGIRRDWTARLTSRGRRAASIWPGVLDEIEQRWRDRYRAAIDQLHLPLQAIAASATQALPLFLVPDLAEHHQDAASLPAAEPAVTLPSLLSQALMLFAQEFDRASEAPLAICANAIRVIGDSVVPERELPHLTGNSPEMSAIGWRLRPYVSLTPDEQHRRGKLLRLTPRGLRAAHDYPRLVARIEARWEAQYGRDQTTRLRQALEALFASSEDGSAPLAAALIAPPGTARAGEPVPSLGRRDLGPAARQRMRDLLAQTETFLRDPANTLPHYPLWDMNRGYGP